MDIDFMRKQQTTIFRQLIYNIVFPVVIALIVLGVINFRNTRNIIKESNKTRNYLISNELTQVLRFQDITLSILEENITPKLENVSKKLVLEYFKSTSKIKEADLKKIREELGLDPNFYDLYIIDTNGIVVNTTFKPDLGLNFFSFGIEHTQLIKKIFKEGVFRSEKFTIEATTRRLKKYTYEPTLDGLYIIELGVRSNTADEIINLIKSTLNDFSVKEKSIVSAELFMNEDDPFSLTKTEEIGAVEKEFIRQRFEKKDTIQVEKKIDGKFLSYQYFFMLSDNSELYKGSVIRIVSDRTNEIKDEYYRLISFVVIFVLVLFTISYLIFKNTRIVTDPIKKLVNNVNRIADGNLNERAEVIGNNEITTLSVKFNVMIEQLEDLYTDLDKKVKERTAEVVAQKEEIESQKDELEKQRDILAEQQKHIMDSILYAKRLQYAILPTDEFVKELFPESFILFHPKDIVSGDIYWFYKQGNKRFFSAIDCTGHGVPGALVSMVGHNWLDYAVKDLKLDRPVDILEALNRGVTTTFKEKDEDNAVKDGMDIALCCVDYTTMKLEFAGAYNPALIIRNGELIQLKGDKCPIGAFSRRAATGYTHQEMDVQKGDMVYVFSDGYTDQFGGEDNRKFLMSNFKKLLVDVHQYPIKEQKDKMEEVLFDWMKYESQLDDILVIGIRI
ncbi:MAG: SpoIIE family protein phosphatase [Bacteroidales bacterium]|nr:MAG: SpoIIE family protein phosphatase [Bacteroidales bacterium]